MASQWLCRILQEELGPLNFQELVELARAGTLSEDDLVREERAATWQPARTVIGLFHAARAIQQETHETTPAEAKVTAVKQTASAAAGRVSTAPDLRKQMTKSVALVMGFAATTIAVAGWYLQRRATLRFPPPAALRPSTADGFYFLGTGPWSTLEYLLLWFDALVASAALAFVIRWSINRRRSS